MKRLFTSLLLSFIFLRMASPAVAQRIYGASQQTGASGVLCLNCTVTNPANAADGNPQTFSQINVTVGIAAQTYQEVVFSQPVTANTPVSVKMGTGDNLADVAALGAISLQAYNGSTPVGTPVSAATLVTAASNNNQTELTIVPGQVYDRVRVTLQGGILGALSSIYLYEAYHRGTGAVACASAVDELHGVSSAILGLGVDVGGVQNPALAIDGNPATFSTLNASVAAAGAYAQQTIIFNAPSLAGDSIILTLSIPQALIDAGVLTNISVQTFNGATSNNDQQSFGANILSVRLLDLSGTRRNMVVAFAPQNVFDRVQLQLGGGIANVLSSINFHEARIRIPDPVITFNGGASSNIQICSGTTATLTASALANTVFNWYAVPTGGTAVFTGNSFTTPILTATTTYYVEAQRNGCTDASARIPVTVNVLPLPAIPVTASSAVNICEGSAATFSAQPVSGVTIKWYAAATGGTALFTGNTFTTPALTATTTYYAEASNSSGCVSSQRLAVTAIVTPLPAAPAFASANVSVNSGQAATITVTNPQAGATYNWYTAATGGSPVHTGIVFTTPAMNSAATYYVSALSGSCASVARTAVTVSVNAAPDIAVTPSAVAVNAGQTATFTASSTIANATFNWYTTANGGTPVFTGAVFTTPPVNANTTFYAEAVDPATNARSPRATATVTINGVPDITVTPPSLAVNPGQTATFTASSGTPNATFNWYTTSTGGSPVFTGATYTTPAQNNNATYYAEAVDPTTNATSSRASATVTVNGAPDITITPPVRAINAGQGTTFTASSGIPGASFNWYTTPSGGTPIFSGPTYTTPLLRANTTYYAEAFDPATNAVSARATAAVTINGTPDISVNPPSRVVNPGETTSFSATSTSPDAVFNWYDSPSSGIPLYTGANFTTPVINSNTTFYAEAVTPSTGATSSRVPASVTVNGAPDIVITPPTRNVNAGQTTTFTASSSAPDAIFRWYTNPSGGNALYTGSTFTTPVITRNTSFYAEAVIPSTGAVSPRSPAAVTINGAPDIAIVPPTRSINPGETTSFTASSSVPGVVFNWYTTPSGGSPVYTGSVYTTPPLSSTATFYAEAVNPSTAATSPRASASATVLINGAPDISITPPTRNVNAGETTSFTASSTTPGAIFNWYDTAIGGTPIFTGTLFSTPVISNPVTFYAEAVNPGSNATSSRVPATVSVGGIGDGGVPAIFITPPSVNINPGGTATFTASSTTPDVVFNWYTAPDGGSPVFTGPAFTTPAINSTTVYYAEAVNPSTDAASPRAGATVSVNIVPDIVVTPTSAVIDYNSSATFTASSVTPGVVFNWYTSTAEGSPAVYTGATFTTPALTDSTRYYAQAVITATGSESELIPVMVTINPTSGTVFVPNAFSPNGDGNNDQLVIYGTLASLDMNIYNQWGQLIYRSQDQTKGWDGNWKGVQQPVGVYVYFVTAIANGEKIVRKGTITLLR